MNIMWFKRDLRIIDQPSLAKALNHGPFIPLIIIEKDLWLQPDLSYRHFCFYRECIHHLQKDLAMIGHDLHIMVGDAISVMDYYHKKYEIKEIYSSQETWNDWTYKRDIAINKYCQSNGICWMESKQNGVVRRLNDRNGWNRQWEHFMNQPIAPIKKQTELQPTANIPTAEDLGIND